MEKVRVKTGFGVFVPLEYKEIISAKPDAATHPYLRFTLAEKHSELLIFNIRVFHKYRISSKEIEQSDCLSWTKRSPIQPAYTPQPTDPSHEKKTGLLLRIKVNQGSFDLRDSNKRFVRLEIECTNTAGQILNRAISQIFQLLPRRRKRDTLSSKDDVIIRMQWQHVSDQFYNGNTSTMPTDQSNNEDLLLNLDEQELLDLFTGQQSELSTASNDDHNNTSHTDQLAVSDSPSQFQGYSDESADRSHLTGQYEATEHDNYMVLHNGNAEVIGNFRALNFYKASDINIKEDVRLLIEDHDPRDVILKIDGVNYKFKSNVRHSTNKRFVGYIAQQIESVVPEAVQLIDGILHVDYEALIPYLSESIKQNFNDIKNITSEQERIKLIVDMLYEDFLKRERGHKQQQPRATNIIATNYTPHERRSIKGSWVRILASVIGAVLVMSAVMFGAYLLIEQKSHEDNNTTAPQQTVVPNHNLDTDRRVLEELFIATNGGSWDYSIDSRAVHWMSEAPMCKWHGVVCAKGRVVELQLVVMNLSGTIPASIGDLDALQNLNFARNNISGTIPATIKNLTNLNQIWLSSNPRLTGTIPDLPLGMTYISLQFTNLTGPIPASIANLTEVWEILLNNNQLTGTIPPLPVSVHFRTFNVSNNQLEGTLPAFTPNTAVLMFDVSNNKLNGTIERLTQLVLGTVALDGNQFSGEIAHLNFSSLAHFTLNNNRFSSFNSSVPRPRRGKLYCDVSNNPLKCPVPDWAAQYCKASCE